MKITKFSQATFIVENKIGKKILIDPGKYNYDNDFAPSDFGKVDLLIITHKHADHHFIEAEKEIIRLHKPEVITNEEIGNENEPRNLGYKINKTGDRINTQGFDITFVATDHFAKCNPIVNFGLLIKSDEQSFYHTSDTRFMESCYYDLELVRNVTLLSVPISNRGVVMGIDESIVFTSQIQPRYVIPMHYDSPKDKPRVNPEDFESRFKVLKGRIPTLTGVKIRILSFGDAINLGENEEQSVNL